jgi:ABC-type multidrug transport system fused ATPase/permease subunit
MVACMQGQFAGKNEELLDNSTRAWWPIQVANRWLSMRLELTGQAIILVTAMFSSLCMTNAGLAGLALTSALGVVGLLNWVTRMGSEVEMGMNSVERMTEYLTYQSEAPPAIAEHRYAAAPYAAAPVCSVRGASVQFRDHACRERTSATLQ